MSLQVQLATTPSYTDLAVKNYSGLDIAAGIAVILDASHPVGNTYDALYCSLPGASDGLPVLGVTTTIVPAGGTGIVRAAAPIAEMTSVAAGITAGALVMNEASTGLAKTLGGGAKAQVGIALTTAGSGEKLLVLLNGCGALNA